jgi:hypothetical protein
MDKKYFNGYLFWIFLHLFTFQTPILRHKNKKGNKNLVSIRRETDMMF